MARRSRDRVTIDLCGIGDAARAAAHARDTTLAVFARQALIAALPTQAAALLPRADLHGNVASTIKLSVRLSPDDSVVLASQARMRGVSQARLVALLIRGAPLPRRSVERDADRAALLASNDKLAALSGDLNGFVHLIRGVSGEQAQALRDRLLAADGQIRTHLDRASAFIGGMKGTRP
jgi:hypothetical protein